MTKIGLFDSGVGGLTVLKELLRLLPNESYLYFGDTARVPYGGRSPETIMRYSFENVNFIMQHDIELLVIPCNTASAIALPKLQKCFTIPIIGVIEPVCKKVADVSLSNRIGVIGTKTTIASLSYQTELLKQLPHAEIFSRACPLFVPLVEERAFMPHIVEPIVSHYLADLKKAHIDTLVLGCTHYPLLASFIQKEMGDEVTILNPAVACAETVRDLLMPNRKEQKSTSPLRLECYVTDDPSHFKAFGEAFLEIPLDVQKCLHF
jgi:glutamate racemase